MISKYQRRFDEKNFEEYAKDELNEFLKFAEDNKDVPIGTFKKEDLEDGSVKTTIFTNNGPMISVKNNETTSLKGYFTDEKGMLEFRSVFIKESYAGSHECHYYTFLDGEGFVVSNENDNSINKVVCHRCCEDGILIRNDGNFQTILGSMIEFKQQEQDLTTDANLVAE